MPPSRLTAEQGQAALLLSEGHALEVVADRVGVDRTTLWRWRQSPAFVAEVDRKRDELLDRGARILAASVPAATLVLAAIVRDPKAQAATRIRAAEAILDRVGLGPTQRVEVVEADPESRLRELLGIGESEVIELTEQPETTKLPGE